MTRKTKRRYTVLVSMVLLGCLTFYALSGWKGENVRVFLKMPVYWAGERLAVSVEIANPYDYTIILDMDSSRIPHRRGSCGLFIEELAGDEEDDKTACYVVCGHPWIILEPHQSRSIEIEIPKDARLQPGMKKLHYEFRTDYKVMKESDREERIRLVWNTNPSVWEKALDSIHQRMETLRGNRGSFVKRGELIFLLRP